MRHHRGDMALRLAPMDMAYHNSIMNSVLHHQSNLFIDTIIKSHVEAMHYMQEVTWLRKQFREVPSGSPAEKRVKFQTIHQSLDNSISINEVQFKGSFRGSEQCLSPNQCGKAQSSACGWH